MDGLKAVESVYVGGQWRDATWLAEVVDPESGALVITATVVDGQAAPVVTALRMSMELARRLRAMAGFEHPAPAGSRVLCYDVEHEFNGARLLEIERRLDALEQRRAEIDELAAEAREERAVADDTLLSVDLMAVYDMMARRERARDGG